jgi:SAM-dependent methyltransferase
VGEHPPTEDRPWRWDESLYAGSAAYYATGRLPYPRILAEALRDELALDGRGRLLDVGCGPGSLTLILAPLFAQAVGVDADAEMIVEAARRGRRYGDRNVRWVRMRAEELPGGLGTFRVATLAQSFHWMDQPRVARAVRGMLEPAGWWVHVSATTHRGVETDEPLPAPRPPREAIAELIERYLGPVRRSGAGMLPRGTAAGEEDVLRGAGFEAPRRVTVPRGEVIERSEDEVVASVYSLSWAAPHLFGERRPRFERELRSLLRRASTDGRFAEKARDIELVLWRNP